jgi:tetratricopeptide (TPR) repeat protein
MTADLLQPSRTRDLAALIRNKAVTYVGHLATMTHEQFVEIVEARGARYSRSDQQLGVGVILLVIGQNDWPILRYGGLPERLRRARVIQDRVHSKLTIVSEREFLEGLALREYLENFPTLYTAATLTEILQLSRQRLNAWVKAGLIEPAKIENGVRWFDFRQVSAAKTICDLVQRGVSVGRLRRTLRHLGAWMPDAQQALNQVAVLERHGELLVRLEQGELVQPDGQFHFDFTHAPEPLPMRLVPGPRTAAEWHELGVEQEQGGFLNEAVESYREALLVGGPDPQICFDLAHAFAGLGEKHLAMERYLQAIEMDPRFGDAWNNLGLLRAEMGRYDEACAAFQRAIDADPNHYMARYNLADTLDELGRTREAAVHWREYLKQDPASAWGAHARKRLAAS